MPEYPVGQFGSEDLDSGDDVVGGDGAFVGGGVAFTGDLVGAGVTFTGAFVGTGDLVGVKVVGAT